MSYEYRVFFPLRSSAPFSLFTPQDWAVFQPNGGKPPQQEFAPASPSSADVEDRQDIYMFDEGFEGMDGFGLKLRGSAGAFETTLAQKDKVSTYNLELKVRKPDDKHAHVSGQPEEWKKVMRANISCTPSGLLRAVLHEVETVAASGKVSDHKKMKQAVDALVARLRSLRDAELAVQHGVAAPASAAGVVAPAPGSIPFRFVSVSKQRSVLADFDGEQTDVTVYVIPASASSGAAASSSAVSSSGAATYQYRSICFEGGHKKAGSAQAQALFQHIVSKYPAGSAAAGQDGAAPTGALIAPYPEFLLAVLKAHEQKQKQSAAAPAAAPAAAAAAAK